MHLYVLARGHEMFLDRWRNDLLARYFPLKYDNKKPIGNVQLSVRPIQLLEIVFPEPAYEQVLELVRPYDLRMKWLTTMLRKGLHLKPIKKILKKDNLEIDHRFVAIHGIGVKKDEYKDGIELI